MVYISHVKSKNLKLTDDQVTFMSQNKSEYPSEQFFISKAIDHYISHIKAERYQKMLDKLNLNKQP